jgi:hypothetical protein
MARGLTVAQRARMPKREFAGPNKSFPDYDRKHQRLAISGATRSYHAGNISKSTEERIQAKERAKLGDKPMAGKTAKEAKRDTKRDMHDTKSRMPAGEGAPRDRHGHTGITHKGPMPGHSMRAAGKNHRSVEKTRGMPSISGGMNGKGNGGKKSSSNWPC